MQLRDSIRPPERYESEHFYTPLVQRSLRQHRNPTGPPCVEFDPNMPPAAFPTLNFPRPATLETDKRVQGEGEEVNTAFASNQGFDQPSHHVENKKNREVVDLEDIPINQIDNYVASNGDLNPIYVKNMATMAAEGLSSADNDMAHPGSDDIGPHNEYTHSILDPKWSDLCPGIQVEIFDNVLQDYDWSTACHRLGLSGEEQDDVEKQISARNAQIEREDLRLKNMRRKQLMTLLKIDNSTRSSQDSHRFVFRKASRGTTGRLQKSTKPDYFTCHAREVANAQRYLYQHGFDPKYAGDWGNSVTAAQPLGSDHDSDMRALSEQLNSGQYMELATGTMNDPIMDVTVDDKTPSISNKQSFINTVGSAAIASSTDMKLRRGDLTAAPRWLNLLYQHYIPDYQPAFRGNKLVRLKIGVERAAQIHEDQLITCIQPANLVKHFPPIDAIYYDPPSWSSGVTIQNTTARPNPTAAQRPSTSQPLPRTMGGNWSYNPVEPHTPTSSMRFQRRLEEARLDAQRTGRLGAQRPANSREYGPFSTPRQTPETKSWPPSTTPGSFISPSSSDGLYHASMRNPGTGSPQTVTSVETSPCGPTGGRPGPGTVYSPIASSNSYQSQNHLTQSTGVNTIQTIGEQDSQQYE
ncbi:hypothetical protein BDV28DRAFT_155735 [Aspergillus coremiiformis]|uniref:Uncharacterized protein n=1 Tax=Aspergillus coremiiformis TaxID=138285 RepID=A0A5N6ZBQ5_9EURO|nr:hypothetical protein BDV28DRAFT_155735 [Aspergillus coremiiformis]